MGGASGGGGRGSRAIRLLLLLVLALAAVEYLFGGILDASPLKTYLYTPIYNATQPTIRSQITPHTIRNGDNSQVTWPKPTNDNPDTKDLHHETTNLTNKFIVSANTVKINVTQKTEVNAQKNITGYNNITAQSAEKAAYNGTSLFITKLMTGIKHLVTTEEVVRKTESPLPLCAKMPLDLGPIPVNKTDLELDFVEKKFPEVQLGGRYAPPNCTALHKVAIIVPYRDRQQHLAVFLNHMHPFLMKQQIEYGIFVIEQDGNKDFNRAKLMNVGFVESQRLVGGWGCFIFHDIDLLPLDTRNMYSCPRQPRHMSASIDTLKNKLPYEDIFGGVSAMTREQFTKVNGFSNNYWGWGGEDDDMFCRLKKSSYHIARYKMSIARYAMLDHKKSVPNPKRYNLLSQTSKTFHKDGLSTLDYQLVKVVQYHLYTHILANINERS